MGRSYIGPRENAKEFCAETQADLVPKMPKIRAAVGNASKSLDLVQSQQDEQGKA
jgi:hypothetical protein